MTTKAQLHAHCLQLIDVRLQELQTAITTVQESRNNETKSSAGDKYETGRAMMQQEEDKLLARLDNTRQMRLQLTQLDPTLSADRVELGSLVQTNARTYYLSVSLGKVVLEGKTYFCISPEAPISQLLLGKAVDESIQINGRKEQLQALH